MPKDAETLTIEVAAGDIEAWSTGDGSPMDGDLGEALIKASESVSREGKKWAKVHIVIRPDER